MVKSNYLQSKKCLGNELPDIKVVFNELDEGAWRQFVNQNPQGSIFHTPEIFQVFNCAKGYRPQVWAAIGEKGKVLAILPLVEVTVSGGLLHRFTTRSIAYGSILYNPNQEGKEALEILMKTYTRKVKNETLFTELRNLSDLSDIQPIFKRCGFIYEEQLDYLIDVNKPVEDVRRAIHKNGRKSIDRAIKRGVVPEEIHDRCLIPKYYELLQKTYTLAKVPLADISLFEAVFDILVPKGMAKMLMARVGNEYVAASLEMPYKDVIYSWYSGYDKNWRVVNPNDFLVWYILEWGAKNGYCTYDFGGAGQSDEPYGVRDFKAKFGGKLVSFGRNSYVHDPFTLAFSRVGYQLYRQVMRYLPRLHSS
jgi:serine/alanine adding enzyme